ncbi:MAG: hypothetical protein ACJA1L_003164 [Paracoccaceae bacterium]|jgi:uncharacterized protein YaaN involved in tellurite resistance
MTDTTPIPAPAPAPTAVALNAEAAATLGALLPLPAAEIVAADQADPDDRARIEALAAQIDLTDGQSILTFGSAAQGRLNEISDRMLDGVRSKDTGPAGAALTRMVGALRGFDVDELNPDRKRSWWDRLIGRATPVADFIAGYEDVRGHIDDVTDELLRHETQLLKDVKMLDKLYEESLAFYHELAIFIAAGEVKLTALDTVDIPAKEADVAAAPEGDAILVAQHLRDLRGARDDLERRVHDLRLTRQVTMQSLPSIRLVQENDKGLIGRIGSTLVNTVPLWRTQLAQAVTIARSREAAGAVKGATDLTNDLLKRNAEQLGVANREVRTQMERGVFDIEAVKEANARLVATIEESLQIADEGKRRRAAAEADLVKMEGELKAALSTSRAPQRPAAPDAA